MQRCCARIAGLSRAIASPAHVYRRLACPVPRLHLHGRPLSQSCRRLDRKTTKPSDAQRSALQNATDQGNTRSTKTPGGQNGNATDQGNKRSTQTLGGENGSADEEDFATLIGALNEADDDKVYTTSASGGRQARIRQEKAYGPGGFAHIDPSKLPQPEESNSQQAWLLALEKALPRRLRASPPTTGEKTSRSRHSSMTEISPSRPPRPSRPSPEHSATSEQTYTPQDISRILHMANHRYQFDLLAILALEQNRWKAVVWLVTRVIEHNFETRPSPSEFKTLWTHHLPDKVSLNDLTADDKGLVLEPVASQHSATERPAPSLDKLTNELHPHHEPLPDVMRKDMLGQIWQGLGQMIINDAIRASKESKPADQVIQPEILEIIAMLHHRGAMPSSIYSYQPAHDSSALRQPPTLHLLSHQIITSLTDAAWRAHETSVVEEAKEKGRVYSSLRPEIPASVYKVHVAGLGHEVWLELVLWTCLHNRFFAQGAAILRLLARQKADNAWSILSWRELASPIMQSGQETSVNWDEVNFIFNTGAHHGDHTINQKKVRRTISAEVIAAFVDATVSHVPTGVGARGIPLETLVRFLPEMRHFMRINNMSLGFTSWDAIILRFIDSQGIDFEKDALYARKIMYISSTFGEELTTVNAPSRNEAWAPTPAYVLDGTAAPIGHIHRILRAHIRLGSFRAAMQVFEILQKVTDQNKERSLQDFFARQQLTEEEPDRDSEAIDFEGRYAGIHYPSFFPQIPTPILADFLDMVVDANALEFGSWLVNSEDIDGPIISERLYGDAIMGPPLVRLAAALEDKQFMYTIFKHQRDQGNGDIPQKTMTALLEQQIERQNWRFVERALNDLGGLPGYSVSTFTTALIIRMMLREATKCIDFEALEKSETAHIFRKMISIPRPEKRTRQRRIGQSTKLTELSSRIWRLLAMVNSDWKDYAWKTHPFMSGRSAFRFVARPFNVILEGVLESYGSEAGKKFLGLFWPAALQPLLFPFQAKENYAYSVTRMDRRNRGTPALTAPEQAHRYDSHRVDINGPGDKKATITIDLRSQPNIATIQLVLRQALRESHDDLEERRKDIEWARQMMQRLGVRRSMIKDELKGLLYEGLEGLKKVSAAEEFGTKGLGSVEEDGGEDVEDDVEAPRG